MSERARTPAQSRRRRKPFSNAHHKASRLFLAQAFPSFSSFQSFREEIGKFKVLPVRFPVPDTTKTRNPFQSFQKNLRWKSGEAPAKRSPQKRSFASSRQTSKLQVCRCRWCPVSLLLKEELQMRKQRRPGCQPWCHENNGVCVWWWETGEGPRWRM